MNKVTEAFLMVAPFFKIYHDYCRNYQEAIEAIHSCRRAYGVVRS